MIPGMQWVGRFRNNEETSYFPFGFCTVVPAEFELAFLETLNSSNKNRNLTNENVLLWRKEFEKIAQFRGIS